MAQDNGRRVIRKGVSVPPRTSTLGTGCTPFYLPTKAEEVLKRIVNPLRVIHQSFCTLDPVMWLSADYRVGVMLGIVIHRHDDKVSVFYGDGNVREFDLSKNPLDNRILNDMVVNTGLQVLYNLRGSEIAYFRGDRVITNIFSTIDAGTIIEVLSKKDYGDAVSIELDSGEIVNRPMNHIVLANEGFSIPNIQSNHNVR